MILSPIASANITLELRFKGASDNSKGFLARPDLDTPIVRQALMELYRIIEQETRLTVWPMHDDDLLICNNHTTLHGRSPFTDRNRHLIRVRMSEIPVSKKAIAITAAGG